MSATDPVPDAPLDNRTLREQVFDHLREEILASRLEPGTELGRGRARPLAGDQPRPLREALGQLTAEGLVTIVPRRGAVVTRLTRQEFIDAYQVREALESLGAAARRPAPDAAEKAELHECARRWSARRGGQHDALLRDQPRVPPPVRARLGNRKLEAVHSQLIAQIGTADEQVGRAARRARAVRGRAPAILAAIDDSDAELAARLLEEHIEVPQRVLQLPIARSISRTRTTPTNPKTRSGEPMADTTLDPPTQFGVNLNNREPLIAPDYDLTALLDLSHRVEELGFDSVWVGDSLFSKPRYEAMALLSAISQRTEHVRLGTACLVSSMRNPLYLALEWATLDVISGGRTILGPCMGNPSRACDASSRRSGCPSPTARASSRRARGAQRSCSARAARASRAPTSTTRTSPSTRVPRWPTAPAADAAADLDRLQPAAGRRQADRADARDSWSAPATASSASATAG